MLISRGTAPEQPVQWAHSSNMAKHIRTNVKTFLKFVNCSEFLWSQFMNFSTMLCVLLSQSLRF